MIEFLLCPDQEFQMALNDLTPLHDKLNNNEQKLFRDNVFKLQGMIDDAIKSKYNKEYCSVGWNFDYRQFTYGGVYNLESVNYKYVELIDDILNKFSDDNWIHHTIIEIDIEKPNDSVLQQIAGEIFNIKNKCYINTTETDQILIDRLINK